MFCAGTFSAHQLGQVPGRAGAQSLVSGKEARTIFPLQDIHRFQVRSCAQRVGWTSAPAINTLPVNHSPSTVPPVIGTTLRSPSMVVPMLIASPT